MTGTGTPPLIAWSRVFPATAEHIRHARQFLGAILDGSPAADDAVLCLSELVTNAILHSKSGAPDGRFTVRAQRNGHCLRVEVVDQGGPWSHPIRPETLDERSQHGRGLRIVDQLAAAWGRCGDPVAGWTVWFEVCYPPPAPVRQAPADVSRWTSVVDGRRLAQLRRQQSLTQADLAAKAGISLTTLGRLERRVWVTCRSRTLARLAAALSVEPVALMADGRPDGHGRSLGQSVSLDGRMSLRAASVRLPDSEG